MRTLNEVRKKYGGRWKWIDGFEGIYAISNKGLLYSFPRPYHPKGRLKKPWLNQTGYWSTKLCTGKKMRGFLLHRLIATAFIPNPTNRPFINHKNGNPKDNRLRNIEWCTPGENLEHARKIGLLVMPSGEDHPCAKLNWKKVEWIRDNAHTYSGPYMARKFKVSNQVIYKVISKGIWKKKPTSKK